jgi:hypothetical protein
MLRKPRNARTGRLTDWKFFVQIYLVRERVAHFSVISNTARVVHWFDDVALCHVDVVPVYESTRPRILRRDPRVRQMDRRLQGLHHRPTVPLC